MDTAICVAELCGITVEDFTNFKGDKYAAALQWQDGRLPEQTKAVGFNEILRAEHPEVEIMAAYTSKYYKGKPALSRRSCGLGQVWYYGAAYSEPIVEAILDEIELVSPAAEWLTLPAEVEFGIRASATESYSFLLNYTDEPLTIHVQQAAIDIITGAQQENDVEIPPFGVMILARANR
jgi:beta-galactosidase